ncbi:hypothetical protein [Natrinema sp. DC36]|uniref:hypothetical protein n=1 Tax=Natrinema sp. DC36 TaxID=2878680 RepID=UPI001CF07CC5|nr:hypothetical protein [Natrinema sp. DC36]
MTGFKSGASGDDPFSSDGDDDEGDAEPVESESSTSTDAASRPDPSDDRDRRRDDRDETSSTAPSSSGLPWIYERNSITDGRAQTVQLHLQQSTLDQQREGKTDVEAVLGESIKKADLREAALLVGLEHVDEVADQLREWGYDFE